MIFSQSTGVQKERKKQPKKLPGQQTHIRKRQEPPLKDPQGHEEARRAEFGPKQPKPVNRSKTVALGQKQHSDRQIELKEEQRGFDQQKIARFAKISQIHPKQSYA